MKRGLPVACAVLVLVAGFGGTSGVKPSLADLSVDVVRYTSYPYPDPAAPPMPSHTETFSLTCDPPAGTLPLAERLCRAIREHPQAMLAPRDLAPTRYCISSSGPGQVTTTITISFNGSKTGLPSGWNCGDPRGRVATRIFEAAISGNEAEVVRLETALRCDEDPIAAVSANLTLASAKACMRGLWTAENERMILAASRAQAIAALDPARLFPKNSGTHSCMIPVGGRLKARTIPGQCGVYVNGRTVSFMENWSGHDVDVVTGGGGGISWLFTTYGKVHRWTVVLTRGGPVVTKQGGVLPPQRWRSS